MAKTPRDLSDPFTREILHSLFEGPMHEKSKRLYVLRRIRALYKDKWGWGVGPKFLFRALIEALGLQEDEDEIMRLAQPKRGRKEESDLAIRILGMKAEGKTVPQIRAIFESEGKYFSPEKIESYLKTRRKKPQHLFW
jgi:hypothetical protein